MKRKQIAITLGAMCLALTLAISVQLKTVQDSNNTVTQSLTENNLRDEVLKWKEKYDDTYEELTENNKILETTRKQATQNDTISIVKQEEIMKNNMLIGTVEVKGAGLEIILEDNNTGLTQDGQEIIDLMPQVVHQEDLMEVINSLNNAGAEAISVNGQRVIQTTAITCEGNVIKINGQRISSPFLIKAIGSPGLLYGSVNMVGGYLYYMSEDGIKVQIKQVEELTVEKYNGVINYKYVESKE